MRRYHRSFALLLGQKGQFADTSRPEHKKAGPVLGPWAGPFISSRFRLRGRFVPSPAVPTVPRPARAVDPGARPQASIADVGAHESARGIDKPREGCSRGKTVVIAAVPSFRRTPSTTGASPTSARRHAFPPVCQARRECKCLKVGNEVRLGCCAGGNAR